jgi:hypothetical protein
MTPSDAQVLDEARKVARWLREQDGMTYLPCKSFDDKMSIVLSQAQACIDKRRLTEVLLDLLTT